MQGLPTASSKPRQPPSTRRVNLPQVGSFLWFISRFISLLGGGHDRGFLAAVSWPLLAHCFSLCDLRLFVNKRMLLSLHKCVFRSSLFRSFLMQADVVSQSIPVSLQGAVSVPTFLEVSRRNRSTKIS